MLKSTKSQKDDANLPEIPVEKAKCDCWEWFDRHAFGPYDTEYFVHDRNVIVLLAATVWMATDIAVIVKANHSTLNYLTNQVWVFGLFVRFFLAIIGIIGLAHCTWMPLRSVRLLATGWFILGAAQWGVMFTFWTLLIIDDGVLDHLINVEGYTAREIMVWNHVRHVTPVILHTMITWEKRDWMTHMTRVAGSFKTTFVAYWGTYIIPVMYGIIHMVTFDDQEVYSYNSTATTWWCALCFIVVCCISGKYLLHIGNDANSVKSNRYDEPTSLLAMPPGYMPCDQANFCPYCGQCNCICHEATPYGKTLNHT